ncbi:MAG: zinc ABC transporter substrate-binding protein [Candidatus Atribacteria bacterium]|nr:zinc ABC transporter substrate-binding protein [Candidatus Atribacteria bacterium]
MKKSAVIVILVLVLFGVSIVLPITAKASNDKSPGIVCTTSILAHLTEEIAQELVSVTTIAPAGMCPAHFDIKPSQIKAVREAKVLISHNFEPWIENLLVSAERPDIDRLILAGPWNIPSGTIAKINQIANILSKQFPQNEQQFLFNAQKLIQNINDNAEDLKTKADYWKVNEYKVITSIHQEPFAQWLGFKVLASYPAPETISIRQFLELLLIGKREKVAIIVDNLQSGTDLGAILASDLKAQQAILTNFPGLIPQTESLVKMLNYNAEQLFKAIGEN